MTNFIPFSKDLAQSLVNSEDLFSVDFDEAWQWLGFANKASAKRKLSHFLDGVDFSTSWLKTSNGRPSEQIKLTVDCFKSLGMMVGTEQGKQVRAYFLECERTVKEVIPAQFDRIKELELLVELQNAERLNTESQTNLILKREAINNLLPPVTAALILGAKVVDRVEYRDRTIDQSGKIWDGLGITYLQKRYDFKTTAECWKALDSVGYGKTNRDAWKPELTAVENHKLNPSYISDLDSLFSEMSRQKLIGE
jgi:anti-repressor protein